MPKSQEFPQTLHRILEDATNNGNSHIISWMPDDMSFRIHNRNLFVSHIMPHYFGSTTIRSFHRQLSHYGFKRNDCPPLVESDGSGPSNNNTTTTDGSYYHEFFSRNDTTLLTNIRRKKNRVSVSSKTVTKKRKQQQQQQQQRQQKQQQVNAAAARSSSTQPASAPPAASVTPMPPQQPSSSSAVPVLLSSVPVVSSSPSNSSPASQASTLLPSSSKFVEDGSMMTSSAAEESLPEALSRAPSLCIPTTAWPVVVGKTSQAYDCHQRVATHVIDLLPSQDPQQHHQDYYSNVMMLFDDNKSGCSRPLSSSSLVAPPSLSTSCSSSSSSSSSSRSSSVSDQVTMFEQEFPLLDDNVLLSFEDNADTADPEEKTTMIDDVDELEDVVEWLDNSFPPDEGIYDDTYIQTSIDFQPNRIFGETSSC